MAGRFWSKDGSWNPIRGCSARHDGTCKARCWAASLAGTRLAHLPQYAGLTEPDGHGGFRWTSKVRFDAEELAKPRHWRKPRVVLLSLMGDLFDPQVTEEQIEAVYGVMAACPQHVFLVLTKRAERRRDFSHRMHATGILDPRKAVHQCPLPNVWEGVSVCDQADAAERIPILLQTPAAHRWVIAEPLLGPVDLDIDIGQGVGDLASDRLGHGLDWLVVGAETGSGARTCKAEWIEDIVRQCQAAGVPMFVKAAPPRSGVGPEDDHMRLDHWVPRPWPRELAWRQG